MKRTNKITFLIGLGAIASDTVRTAALEMLGRRFGGFTVDDVTGGWVDPATDELVVEDSLRVVVHDSSALYSEDDVVVRNFYLEVEEVGRTLAAMFAQKCILVSVEPVAVALPEGV